MAVRALIVLVLISSPLAAATYYVDCRAGADSNPGTSADSPWKTLERANTALAPGDTCIVRGGLYENSVIAPAQSGTEAAPITYAAWEKETPEVTGGRSGSIINLTNRSYVIIRGFKIHSPSEHDWTVNVSGEKAMHNRIENCDVSDPKGYVCIDIAEKASYNEVAGCSVHDTGNANEQSGDCIVINGGAHHNTVRNNRAWNGCHAQIMALKGSAYNRIIDNECFSTDRAWAGAGINLPLGADNTEVSGNRIHDLGFITSEKCAVQIDSANNSVHHNLIYNVGAFGISPQSYPFGGTAQAASGNIIAHNTIYRTGRQGFFFVSKRDSISRGNRFVNNIIVASDSKWYDKPAHIMVFDTYHLNNPVEPGEWFDNTFERNVFYHATAGEPDMVLYNFRTGSKSWSLPELEKQFPKSFLGNIEADPLLAAPEKGDLSLKPASPAIDAGVIVSPDWKFEGKAPDVGALESKK